MQKKSSIARPILGALLKRKRGGLSASELAGQLRSSTDDDTKVLVRLVRVTLSNLERYGWITEAKLSAPLESGAADQDQRDEKRFRMTRRHLPAPTTALFSQSRLERERERRAQAEFTGNGPTAMPGSFFRPIHTEEE